MAVTYNLMNLGMNIIRMWKPTAPLALMVGNVVFDLVKWLVLAFMFVRLLTTLRRHQLERAGDTGQPSRFLRP